MTATPLDTNNRKQRGNRKLILSALVGPLSWSAFFLVGYLLAEAACIGGFWQREVAGMSLVVIVVVALALVAALASAGSALWSYRRWRAADRPEQQTRKGEHVQQTEDLAAFLALAGLLLNLLFTLATIVTALSMIFLVPCRWT